MEPTPLDPELPHVTPEPPYHDQSLYFVMQGVIQHFKEDLEEYVNSLPQSPPIGELRNIVRSLFRVSQDLVDSGGGLKQLTREHFTAFHSQLLYVLFEFELADDLASELAHAARRVQDLLGFAVEVAPGPAAQDYLRRVARCFTWGYRAETLILSRSVLEQVLEEVVSDADVENALRWRSDAFPPSRVEELKGYGAYAFHLEDRIRAAYALGRLSQDQREVADQIRYRGNKALHDAPSPDADVFGTVKALTEVIDALCTRG